MPNEPNSARPAGRAPGRETCETKPILPRLRTEIWQNKANPGFAGPDGARGGDRGGNYAKQSQSRASRTESQRPNYAKQSQTWVGWGTWGMAGQGGRMCKTNPIWWIKCVKRTQSRRGPGDVGRGASVRNEANLGPGDGDGSGIRHRRPGLPRRPHPAPRLVNGVPHGKIHVLGRTPRSLGV